MLVVVDLWSLWISLLHQIRLTSCAAPAPWQWPLPTATLSDRASLHDLARSDVDAVASSVDRERASSVARESCRMFSKQKILEEMVNRVHRHVNRQLPDVLRMSTISKKKRKDPRESCRMSIVSDVFFFSIEDPRNGPAWYALGDQARLTATRVKLLGNSLSSEC